MTTMNNTAAQTKSMVVAIHKLLPDEPIEALSVIALAFAYCAVGGGYKRHQLDDALDVAFAQAEREARRQGWQS